MIDWTKYGFEEDKEFSGIFSRRDFPFEMFERESYLRLGLNGGEYTVSKDEIPATNRSIENLLKAFCLPLS